ncbi:hypothetical protein HU200_020771 [Digitaria exilis]|uniref:Glutaredoxin domain-containing protein n=1 Tax=Digitaria exilis TaxID=1010633 RepID=A0A835KET4_9POAL|nr:hypothetical protein HU200_020771 [Digitaria exilis]
MQGGGGGVSCAVAGEAASAGTPQRRRRALGLTIDPAGDVEAPAERIGRLVRESPVVIFARRGCCMCHVMRRLLAAVGRARHGDRARGGRRGGGGVGRRGRRRPGAVRRRRPRRRARRAHGPPPQRPPRSRLREVGALCG